MPIEKRSVQDRRSVSRITTNLACQLTFNGIHYQAVIKNLSLKGALLISTFIPPQGGLVSIRLRAPDTLSLIGKVVRTDWTLSEPGTAGALTIQFSHNPPGLIGLIGKLASKTSS